MVLKKAPEPAPKSKKPSVLSERATKGLSLMKLLKSTPPYVKMKARDEVVIKKYDPRSKTKGGHRAITASCVSMIHKAPTVHKQTIVGLDKDIQNISKQKQVTVSCTCEWFCYHCEYALWTWGASKIKHSNGEPATVTNPGNYPMMCKHLVKVSKLIIERGE